MDWKLLAQTMLFPHLWAMLLLTVNLALSGTVLMMAARAGIAIIIVTITLHMIARTTKEIREIRSLK